MKTRKLPDAALLLGVTLLLISSVVAASATENSTIGSHAVNSYIRSRISAVDGGGPVLHRQSQDDCVVDDHEVSHPIDGTRQSNTVCNTGSNEASAAPSLALDGGFEQGTPNPSWGEFHTKFGTPLCTVAGCGSGGGTGPRSGNWWAWFGGVNGTAEYGVVWQDIAIPAGTSSLGFWLEIPETSDTGYDFFDVWVDNDLIFTVSDLQADPYSSYNQVVVDLTGFGDCQVHNLAFFSETAGAGVTNFFVDDVTVEVTVPATFCDLPTFHWAWQYVEAISTAGLTAGYPDGTYRPDNPVTRAEMAVFILKGIYGSSYTPPTPNGSHPFSDISGHWAEAWMEQLYDEGLTSGYPDSTYRPENRVSRAEMAVFLLKAMHGSSYAAPAPSGGSFSDVAGHWAEAWIEQLKEEGITSGYPDGTYRPENQVTRAEMAVFLVNAFGLPLP